MFFEDVGILVNRKLLDIDIAIVMFTEPVLTMWEKNGHIFKQMHSDKCFWFEYLYNELKKAKEKQKIP